MTFITNFYKNTYSPQRGLRRMEQWKKNVYVMVAVQFVMMSGVSIIVPFLPLFVGQLGVAEATAIRSWSGVLIAIHALFAALFSPIWGSLADRWGRKLMVVRSCLGVAFFTFLMGYAHNVYQLLVLRILMGCFSGFSAAALTLIAAQTSKAKLGYALGLLQIGQVLGVLVGPLLGGVLADLLSYRTTFRVAGTMALAAGMAVILLVREEFVAKEEAAGGHFLQELAAIWHLPIIKVMFVVLFFTQLSIRMVEPIMSLFVASIVTGQALVATVTGIVFSVTGLAQFLSLPLIARNSDSWGHRRVLIICLIGGALSYFPQALVGSVSALFFFRFVYGLFLGGTIPMINALIGLLTPVNHRGRVYGLTSSAFFLGGFIGPLTGGVMAARLGFLPVFILVATLLVVNALLVIKKVPE